MINTIWWAFIALACFTAGIGILREAFTLFYEVKPRETLYTYWRDDPCGWVVRRENGSYERDTE